jgi:hypothetical protein
VAGFSIVVVSSLLMKRLDGGEDAAGDGEGGYSVFIKTVAIRAGFFCRKRTQRSQKALGWIFIL